MASNNVNQTKARRKRKQTFYTAKYYHDQAVPRDIQVYDASMYRACTFDLRNFYTKTTMIPVANPMAAKVNKHSSRSGI